MQVRLQFRNREAGDFRDLLVAALLKNLQRKDQPLVVVKHGERTLNQLGKAGWELVEVVRGDGEQDHTRVAVLKRKLFWS